MEVKPTVDYDLTVSYLPVKLSVLIATMPSRKDKLQLLIASIQDQALKILSTGDIDNTFEWLTDDSLFYNIGVKRDKLLKQAKGEYIVFIDDDDEITSNYISLILEACRSGADCIGINGIITTNGRDKRKWFISKEYGKWFTGPDGTYFRTPNHISPVKRELALKAGFPDVSFGEDAEYSRRLLPLLKTETIITQPLYHYNYWQVK